MTKPEAPTFLEALGELASAADAGPALTMGNVTAISGGKVWVNLSAGAGGQPVACNRLRTYTPVVGHAVLVALLDGGEPVILDRVGDGTAVAAILAASTVNTDALDASGFVTAAGFISTANGYFPPEGRDGALRWAQDGAAEFTNRVGTSFRGLRCNRVHANDIDSNGYITALGLCEAAGFVATSNAFFPMPGRDGALRWGTDGAAEFVNRVGTVFRGLRVSRLHANDIDSNGDIVAQAGIRANGGLSCGGTFDSAVRSTGANWSSRFYDGAISWDAFGALVVSNYPNTAGRGVYASNFAAYGSSWRELKTDHESIESYLGHSAVDEIKGLDVAAWRYTDPDAPGGDGNPGKRIGLHLNELHPKLRVRAAKRGRIEERAPEAPPSAEQPEQAPETEQGSYDLIQLLNLAVAAIQEQQQQIDALTDRVAQLDKRGGGPPRKETS